jgi:hypothetical protein
MEEIKKNIEDLFIKEHIDRYAFELLMLLIKKHE